MRERNPLVLGIARGGVPVAAEVARVLAAPLDVIVVRKIGAPRNPEYGVGALAEGGVRVLSERAVQALRIDSQTLARITERAERELAERVSLYRAGRPPLSPWGRATILIDDGLATGHTAQAAARAVRARGAASVIVAVPVASPASLVELGEDVDEIICVQAPSDLRAIGNSYEDFTATSDEKILAELSSACRQSDG
jgi:predicted phosphoribosyltransferase